MCLDLIVERICNYVYFPENVPLYKLKQRVQYLDRLQAQLTVLVTSNAFFEIQSSYKTPFLYVSDDLEYWDAQLLLFPYLQWVTHWVDFLKRHYRVYAESRDLIERLSSNLTHSQPLFESFKSSPTEFLNYITR